MFCYSNLKFGLNTRKTSLKPLQISPNKINQNGIRNQKRYFNIKNNPEHENIWAARVYDEVEWGQMDAFQHVNNTIYLRWMESARIQHLKKADLLPTPENSVSVILAETNVKFLKPVTFPDRIRVSSRTMSLGSTSWNCEYLIESEKLSSIVAKGTARLVFINYATGQKIVLDENKRKKLHDLEAPRTFPDYYLKPEDRDQEVASEGDQNRNQPKFQNFPKTEGGDKNQRGNPLTPKPPTPTKLAVLKLFQQGKSIEEIAEQRKILPTTALSYLADCWHHGNEIDYSKFNISPEVEHLIAGTLATSNGPEDYEKFSSLRLQTSKEQKDLDLSWGIIRLVLTKLQKDEANKK